MPATALAIQPMRMTSGLAGGGRRPARPRLRGAGLPEPRRYGEAPDPLERDPPARDPPAFEPPARELPPREVPLLELPAREVPVLEPPALDAPVRDPALAPPLRDPAAGPIGFELVVRARAPLADRGRGVPVPVPPVPGPGSPLAALADRGRLVPVRGRAALLGARVAMVPTVTRNRLRSKDPVCSRVSRQAGEVAWR